MVEFEVLLKVVESMTGFSKEQLLSRKRHRDITEIKMM